MIPVWVTQFGEVPVLLNNVEDAPACDLTGPLLRLRMPGSLTVGQILLSVRVLNALSPGDVLLGAVSPEVASAIKAQAYAQLGIRWGGLAYRHVSGIATLCGSILTLKEWRMSDQDEISNLEQSFAIDNLGEEAIEEETTMDSVVELSELELPVKMEIGTIPISLEQLKSIRPGYVIALPQSIEGAKVRLSVGGQTIGQGELVAVGEHLGVRIIQMVQTYESAA
ncbi:type III secretion system apparatus protein YscQ/HrcQ [Caballeronia calidae]|uniref:Type III secretion system apparatus protein YscQ/HrcQ n=1 Tax=Caballeronia calidae TaxID=1777139 RepID=A0A158EGA3_9BURK|nr:type III secretion system apparatus protein YscQ/HrcQ [Caballeronia calidae]